jgi:hypothetical protein
MDPTEGIRKTSAVFPGTPQGREHHLPSPTTDADGRSDGRALIAVSSPTTVREVTPSMRPSADFLAHLIATAGQLPQTRERRRSEPQDAIAAYASTAAGELKPTPQKLSRSS